MFRIDFVIYLILILAAFKVLHLIVEEYFPGHGRQRTSRYEDEGRPYGYDQTHPSGYDDESAQVGSDQAMEPMFTSDGHRAADHGNGPSHNVDGTPMLPEGGMDVMGHMYGTTDT
ncbi:hypothetical protein [Rhodanobacter sp. FW106-PBR-R2A-1-13]|uniref:hypothetical protein n=1 Tax=Rhodanobacter sp. FW106-PBR-R2A-1-13 TaxID=3454845 RepID=UPI0034E5E209